MVELFKRGFCRGRRRLVGGWVDGDVVTYV